MNLHEYQGKEVLHSFGVTIQRGIVAQTPDQARQQHYTNTSVFLVRQEVDPLH